MLSKTILVSLLASTTFALSADTTLPSFALAGPETTTLTRPTSTPQSTTTTSPADDDQPAASRSTQIPASLSFNPSNAPAFTPSSGAIDFTTLPAFPSTPCASTVLVSSYSRTADLSVGQPIPTTSPAGPTPTPQAPTSTPAPGSDGGEKQEPCEEEGAKKSKSSVQLTPSSARPTPAPSAAPGQDTGAKPYHKGDNKPAVSAIPLNASVPIVSSTTLTTVVGARPTPIHPALPAIPSGLNLPHRPEGHPGPGSGRPHPSARYSRYSMRPQPSTIPDSVEKEPAAGQGVPPSPTPCTLETKVRPGPTGV